MDSAGASLGMSKSVTFVTSSKLFWDNPYTRAHALRLMQEDVTDVTPGSSPKANPPTRVASPPPWHAIFQLGSSQAGEMGIRGKQ